LLITGQNPLNILTLEGRRGGGAPPLQYMKLLIHFFDHLSHQLQGVQFLLILDHHLLSYKSTVQYFKMLVEGNPMQDVAVHNGHLTTSKGNR
jgi:hypothetical protein